MNDTYACKTLAKETRSMADRLVTKYENEVVFLQSGRKPWEAEMQKIANEFCEGILLLQRMYPNRKAEEAGAGGTLCIMCAAMGGKESMQAK